MRPSAHATLQLSDRAGVCGGLVAPVHSVPRHAAPAGESCIGGGTVYYPFGSRQANVCVSAKPGYCSYTLILQAVANRIAAPGCAGAGTAPTALAEVLTQRALGLNPGL